MTLTSQATLVDYYYIREQGIDVPGLLDGQVPSETVSIEIQGELNQEEQDDIAALQKDLATLISSGLETDDDTSQSLLSDYDSLSQFTLSVRATKAKASDGEMAIVSYPANSAQSVVDTEENSSVATCLSLVV